MASAEADSAIAQDILEYLKELDDPDARRIRFLTQMVDEQSEHAAAISEALKDYIRKTAPERKLLALYVLDSIAKNLAGAFTQHLSRGLVDIYWLAYERANERGRKQLVSLLNSWENPGPGVSARNPVFPLEVTRPMRNRVNAALAALARINASHTPSFAQSPSIPPGAQGHQYASHINLEPWRYSTPPHYQAQQPPAPYASHAPPYQPFSDNEHITSHLQHSGHHAQAPFQTPALKLSRDHQKILNDLDSLITYLRERVSAAPHDPIAHGRLADLLKLRQAVHSSPNLGSQMWASIKQQVDILTRDHMMTGLNTGQIPRPQQPPGVQTGTPPLPVQPFNPPGILTNPAAAQMPDTDILAQLSVKLGTAQRGGTPVPAVGHRGPPQTTSATSNATLHSNSDYAGQKGAAWQPDNDFLAQLSKLTGAVPPNSVPGAAPPVTMPPSGLSNLTMLLGPRKDVELAQASIRQPRPDLFRTLWAGRSQCKTCGRRFPSTSAGKERKQRHMDYHFRTRMRMADTKQNPIATRSWYSTENDWIYFREVDDADPVQDAGRKGSKNAEGSDPKKKERDELCYVRVPSDVSKANKICPICQEDFENSWHDGAQEWVWMDCTKGPDGRFFHNSCRQEVLKDEAAAREREGRALDRAAREREAVLRMQQQAAKQEPVKSDPEPVQAEHPKVEETAQALQKRSSPSKSPDSVLGKRKATITAEEDEDDYEPTEHERRVNPRIDAQA